MNGRLSQDLTRISPPVISIMRSEDKPIGRGTNSANPGVSDGKMSNESKRRELIQAANAEAVYLP
jgi:hypothetical protein